MIEMPRLNRRLATLPLAGLALAAVALLALPGCSQPIGVGTTTANRSAATPRAMAACRARADEVYERQNRAEVYHDDMMAGGMRDSPFAAAGTPGSPTAGLAGRYARETMLDDCLKGLAGTPGATPEAPLPAGATPVSAPPHR